MATGDRLVLELTAAEVVEAFIGDLKDGVADLTDQAATEDLVVDGETANRILAATATADSQLIWAGTVTTDWAFAGDTATSHLVVLGSIGGDLHIVGAVSGNMSILGSVGGDLHIVSSGSVGGYLSVDGLVGGEVFIDGSIAGDLYIGGSIGMCLRIGGSVGGKGVLTPAEVLTLGSVRGARLGAEVYVGDRVRIDSCDFRQCPDLDKLLLVGTDLFPRGPWWSRGTDRLVKPDGATHAEMASVYRRLRVNLEGRSNRPGAAIFYRGEMRSRFWASVKAGRLLEALVIALYWLMSGFGLNPWRPVALFVALAALAARAFGADGALGGVEGLAWVDLFQFSVRSMVSFVSPPDAPLNGVLDRNELWLQLGLRFLGPLLFAQFVLAVRDRVAR